MIEVTEIPIDVATLEATMHRSHAIYSDRFADRQAAEMKLQETATRLGTLNNRRKSLAHAAERLRGEFIQLLIGDPTSKIDTGKVVAAREEIAILDSAVQTLQRGSYRDLERACLEATLAEAQSQHASEEARLAHHKGALNQRLAAVAELAGGEITLSDHGAIAEQLRDIVSELVDKMHRAKEALNTFDRVAREREDNAR
jgi:hypothetical protein